MDAKSRLRAKLERVVVKEGRRTLASTVDRKEEYRSFRTYVAGRFNDQVGRTMNTDAVETLITAVTKSDASTRRKLLQALSRIWLPATQVFDENQVVDFLIWSATLGGKTAIGRMAIAGTFELTNSAILRKLEKQGTWLLKDIDTQTKQDVVTVVAEGIDKRMSAYEIQQHLANRFRDDISPYRAEMITRTEFNNAATLASEETYKRNGVEKREWVKPAGDNDICSRNDGVVRIIGKQFPSGHVRTPAHPNCKCDLYPVVPDDTSTRKPWLGA